MERARWIGSRLAAAIVGALLVGLLAALIFTLVGVLTCGHTCSLSGTLLYYAIWTPFFSVPLGTLPGLAALTLSPAKDHPWRALPVLALGTIVGVGIWLFLAWFTNYSYPGAFGIVALFVIPSATGLAVAWNIRRLPKPFQLANGH